ncbi:MAG: hypothetical protein K6G76_07135 [Lachnospiraceae bacterium]|nr:hypothetical protein [Lachnospiraceae bacterium]
MQQQDFFMTEEFQRLHPLKQRIIKELATTGNNSSIESMIPKIMTINKELSKRNLSFTKSESRLMIDILTRDMSPEKRQKIDMIMSMM